MSLEGKKAAAQVNKEVITYESLDKLYDSLAPERKAAMSKAQLLNGMISQKLLLQEAKKEGITATKEELEQAYQDYLASLSITEDELKQKAGELDVDLDEVKDSLERDFIIQKLIQQKINTIATDEEIVAFYEANKETFVTPEAIRTSHILVNDSELAEEIIAKLDNGESFEELAKNYSTDSTASIGGDLGSITKGQTVKEFEDAAFSLKEGEYSSQPVQSQFGYHIIKVYEKNEEGLRSLEEVSLNIENYLSSVKQSQEFAKYVAGLRSNATVLVSKEFVKEIEEINKPRATVQ